MSTIGKFFFSLLSIAVLIGAAVLAGAWFHTPVEEAVRSAASRVGVGLPPQPDAKATPTPQEKKEEVSATVPTPEGKTTQTTPPPGTPQVTVVTPGTTPGQPAGATQVTVVTPAAVSAQPTQASTFTAPNPTQSTQPQCPPGFDCTPQKTAVEKNLEALTAQVKALAEAQAMKQATTPQEDKQRQRTASAPKTQERLAKMTAEDALVAAPPEDCHKLTTAKRQLVVAGLPRDECVSREMLAKTADCSSGVVLAESRGVNKKTGAHMWHPRCLVRKKTS